MSIAHKIESVLVTRPQFNDTNLGNEGLWVLDNSIALARYWSLLGRALGLDDKDGEEDLELWLKTQHDQQLRMKVAA